MQSVLLARFITGAVFLIIFFNHATLLGQDSAAADELIQRATNAQNSGDFRFAAGQWELLIKDFPQSSQIGLAHYQAGYCQIQIEEFAKAADHLRQAIKSIDPAESVTIAQSYLFLGFSQSKLGRALVKENPNEANQWLTTATKTFATLIDRFPDFEDNDQALFFQGDAFEALQRWDDAASSYQRMLAMPSPEFKLDGLYSLAIIRSRQGKYDDALRLFQQFESAGADHADLNEVRFRAAQAMTQLARSAENLGETESRQRLLSQASEKFGQLYESRDPQWSGQARYEQAICQQQLGDHAASATMFESILQLPEMSLTNAARVYAGREFLRAGDANSAINHLEKAIALDNEYAAEAAHWLAQLHLRAGQAQTGFRIGRPVDRKLQTPL